jgi:hypothetical protein
MAPTYPIDDDVCTLIWNKWNKNWMEGEGALPPGNWKIITFYDYAMSIAGNIPIPKTTDDWRDHIAECNVDTYFLQDGEPFSLMSDDVEWNPNNIIVFASTYVVVKNESVRD